MAWLRRWRRAVAACMKEECTVDLTKEFGPSSSGKTIIIASTDWNVPVPYREEKIGVNAYRKK